MKNLVEKLLVKMTKDGKVIRGSVSRVSEYCDVAHTTVKGWVVDGRSPNKILRNRLEALLADENYSMSGKIPGPKGKRKVAVDAGV